MDFDTFVELRRSGKIVAGINNDTAFRLIDYMKKPERAAILFWSLIAVLVIPVSIGLAIFWQWWVIFFIILTPIIHKANKRSAAEFILDEIDKDEDLFNLLVANNILNFRE